MRAGLIVLALVTVAGFLAAFPPAPARSEADACQGFEWPLETERTWFKSGRESVASGASLAKPPEKAIELGLEPQDAVIFELPPGGKAKTDGVTYGGVIAFDGAAKPGMHQITLGAAGWIDVVQNGAALKAKAHTGSKTCAEIRKSVRFEVGAGRFVVQVSGVSEPTLILTVRPAE